MAFVKRVDYFVLGSIPKGAGSMVKRGFSFSALLNDLNDFTA